MSTEISPAGRKALTLAINGLETALAIAGIALGVTGNTTGFYIAIVLVLAVGGIEIDLRRRHKVDPGWTEIWVKQSLHPLLVTSTRCHEGLNQDEAMDKALSWLLREGATEVQIHGKKRTTAVHVSSTESQLSPYPLRNARKTISIGIEPSSAGAVVVAEAATELPAWYYFIHSRELRQSWGMLLDELQSSLSGNAGIYTMTVEEVTSLREHHLRKATREKSCGIILILIGLVLVGAVVSVRPSNVVGVFWIAGPLVIILGLVLIADGRGCGRAANRGILHRDEGPP